MKKRSIALFTWLILLVTFVTPVFAQSNLKPILSTPYRVDDIMVSADGKYLAAINETTLTYYSVEDGSLLWWFNNTVVEYGSTYNMSIQSVVISADGKYVAIGYGDPLKNGGLSYFNDSTTRSGKVVNATWTQFYSAHGKGYGGEVYKRCIDMSDDGETISVAGTGNAVYYFTNCSDKTGTSTNHYDWIHPVYSFCELTCLDMTPDGKYFVAAGEKLNDGSYARENFTVAYFNNTEIRWHNTYAWFGKAYDIAISDDGAGVCIGYSNTNLSQSGLLYWNNSNNVENIVDPDNPVVSWYYNESILKQTTVAMSSNGEKLLGGSNGTSTLYFWSDAMDSYSGFTAPDWSWSIRILDVALSGDGGFAAAVTSEGNPFLRVIDDGNNSLSVYKLDHEGKVISMSRDGAIIATGSESGGTLNVFKLEDATVTTSTETGDVGFTVDQGGIAVLEAVDESELPEEGKPALIYPHGFFTFNITGIENGATVNITLVFPEPVPNGTQYCKYGPTPNNTAPHYYLIPIGSDDGDNEIWITITDGEIGDNDLTVNGVIIDDGGPGTVYIPVGGEIIANTISQIRQLSLIMILIISGLVISIKKKRIQ